MKVLVTGGGGFLGKYIINELLAEGHRVSSLGRSPQPELEKLGVHTFQGNIAHYDEIANFIKGHDAVIHTAAKAGVWGSWDEYYITNVIGSKNIAEACRIHNLKYLVYTSTPSVVFNGNDLHNADESQPYGKNWLCHYAHTKSIAEKFILQQNSDSLKTVALRPHLIWGLGDPHIVPKIIQRAKSNKLKIVGSGNNRVDLTHVKNAAHAHILALKSLINHNKSAGKAYFISDDSPVNLWDWINSLLTKLNIKPISKSISQRKAYSAGHILEVIYKTLRIKKNPPMTRFVATELAKDHFFNISAAKSDCNDKPIISNNDGLNELMIHYRQKRSL